MPKISLIGFLTTFALLGALAQTKEPATPRVVVGHPGVLWDREDIAAYKSAIASDPRFDSAFDDLRATGDKRIKKTINVPAHKLEAGGVWTFPEFKRGYQDASGKWMWEWNFNTTLQQRSADVSNLGMIYALTGDEKYAEFAKRILLELKDAYGNGEGDAAPDANGYDHFAAYGFDGGDAGMFLTKACHGYDLIYNSTSISPTEHARIENDLIRPMAEHLEKTTFMYKSHGRWGMVCLYGVLVSGVTLNDPTMVDLALYGQGGANDNVTGGFMDCFRSGCLREGVVWGADTKPEDQMASVSVLTAVAEVMWRRGVDLYTKDNKVMKKAFDAGLANPLIASLPGADAYPYAFLHYKEDRYKFMLRMKPSFTLALGEHLPWPPISSVP